MIVAQPPKRRKPRPRVRRKPWEHPSISSQGGSRAWSKMVERVVKEEPWCRLRLPGCTGRSQTADHIRPKVRYPRLAMVRANLRGSCHWCNGHRKDRDLEVVRQEMLASGKYSAPPNPPAALNFFRKKES